MRLDLCIVATIASAALMIVVLLLTLRRLAGQLVKTNEQLLVLFASWKVGPDAARTLVAMNKPPQRPVPGVTKPESAEVKKGIVVDYNLGGL